MAQKRSGLGKGISALIPTAPQDGEERPVDIFFPGRKKSDAVEGTSEGASTTPSDASAKPVGKTGTRASSTDKTANEYVLTPVPGAQLAYLDPNSITPNANQPRHEFDEDDLRELTHSVKEFGVLQPIVVRPIEKAKKGRPQYELIMGERRLRATKAAGLESIPAVVRRTEDEDMLRDALLENLHRAQLNPLEEASAYQQLLADFGITQEQLADRLGRSRPQITNMIRLLKLPESVQRRVAAGVLSAGHARVILAAGDETAMEALADRIIREDLSVRAAEAIVQKSKPARAKRPVAGTRRGYLDEVAERLGDQLDTRVRVSLGSARGQLTIDFATIADLKRILAEIGYQDADA